MEKNPCRIFLGIPIPKYIYEKLRHSLIDYKDLFYSGHWILPENAHITIRFFGDIPRDQLQALWIGIKNKIQLHRHSFTINIEKIATFPNEHSSLVAAYIMENEHIQRLFSLINEVSIDSTMSTRKAFMPHITLFRNKNDHILKLPNITTSACEFKVTALTLYESILIDDQRMYRQLFSELFY